MTDRIDTPSIPLFTAPLAAPDGSYGVWYGEYCGIFSAREFIIWTDGRVEVAPFDFPFRQETRNPVHPPDLPGVTPVAYSVFEALWERTAQPRLHVLAQAHTEPLPDEAHIHYFHSPFPAEFKFNEGSSDIYAEFAGGVARREVEVWENEAVVSPYECGLADMGAEVYLNAARGGVDELGEPVDLKLRPREISHLEFEAQGEAHGLPRLRALAAQSSG